MVQTPQQRRANNIFAKKQQGKMGKPQADVVKKEKPQKPPVSKAWLYLLIFVVCGGLVFELLRVIFSAGSSFF